MLYLFSLMFFCLFCLYDCLLSFDLDLESILFYSILFSPNI